MTVFAAGDKKAALSGCLFAPTVRLQAGNKNHLANGEAFAG